MATPNSPAQAKTINVKIGPIEIEFLNLRTTPLREHLQAFSVALNLCLTAFGTTFGPALLIFLFFFTRWWLLVPLYIAWIYYDRHTGFRGGRKLNWFRNLKIFEYFRDFFPVKLIKTAELPTGSNYLMVMYPHGILPMGVLPNFATSANKIETEVFPGIDMRFITLDINFYCPVTREYFLSLGACGASESSITYLLNSEPSKAVVLVAGGAAEAGLAHPGNTYTIITSRRKGFVRVALKTGASLVPVFSFNETNVYDQYDNKLLLKIQDKICRLSGIRPIVPKGRGFFQNTFGFLPMKVGINTVVGKPIPVPKVENPSKELIDEYHTKFVEALSAIFEEHKHKYDMAGSEAKLVML